MSTDRDLAALVAAFRAEGLIDSYLGPLRPGKEAQIHCCRRRDGGFAILKFYTAIAERGFRDDAVYGLGTGFADARELRAMRAGNGFGKAHKLALWTFNEVRNAHRLHRLGLPVPEPLGQIGPAVLMRMIGGPDRPAPQLREVDLDRHTAVAVLPLLQADILRMLSHDLIHGDLSPYNVLWHRGRHWFIDTPQMVRAQVSPFAHELFVRDCVSLLGYLRRRGADVDPEAWAESTWSRWLHGDLTPAPSGPGSDLEAATAWP